MSKEPFHAEQFTATQWDSALDKATWANAMSSWAKRGFTKNGWRENIYHQLHVHMYGHIAHYNQEGFYAAWFADIHRQLGWLQYAVDGGAFAGGLGDPAYTWSDVELALSVWIHESGLIDHYQQLCSQDIETKERTLLAHLQLKYPSERCDQTQADLSPGNTTLSVSASPVTPGTTSHQPCSAGRGSDEPRKPRYVQFSLLQRE